MSFSTKHSILRTIIFTCGHFLIDVTVSYFITGAKIELLAVSAIISPLINAVWYFLLDKCIFCRILAKSINK